MNKTALVLLLISGLLFQQLIAQSVIQRKSQLSYELDKLLSDQFKFDGPGCVAVVAVKGQVIYKSAYGLADTRLNKPMKTEIAFGHDSITFKSYKLIKKEYFKLKRTGYKLPEGTDAKNVSGFEINYGSRSTIPILSLRKTGKLNGFNINTIYVPEDDIYIELFTNSERNISNNPIQTIFNKVLADVFGSLGFKDKDNSRLVFYHFLLTVKVLPQGGIIKREETSHVYINGDTRNLHYTTNGTEPVVNSPVYKNNIKLTSACTLKIKVIPSAGSDTLKSSSFVYIEGVAPEPVEKINGLKPGLEYAYYEGLWSSLPDFSTLTPKRTGIAKIPDFSVALKQDSCAIQFNGYLYVGQEGMYNIYSVSDDGSAVYLNDKLIVNNDGAHGTLPEAYLIPLKKGYYPFKVLYFENSGGQELQVGYWTDRNEPKPFTKEMFFHK